MELPQFVSVSVLSRMTGPVFVELTLNNYYGR
jgi:hypothetical protein